MAVSKRLRYEVLRRDNHTCRYCGAKAPDVEITVDHVVPKALGGSDEPSNLVAACRPCNDGKTSSNPDAPLVAEVSENALQWSRAMAQAAEKMRAEVAERQDIYDQFDKWWSGWTYGEDKLPIPRAPGWQSSIDSFLTAGLPLDVLHWCVNKAMGSKAKPGDTWRYMCGIAWRKVTELQGAAKSIASGIEPPAGIADSSAPDWAGRYSLARELLDDMSEEESAYFLECSDVNEYLSEDEQRTKEEEACEAVATALNSARCNLDWLVGKIRDTFHALPPEIGEACLADMRASVNIEDPLSRMASDAWGGLLALEDLINLPAATAWTYDIPDEERTEWFEYARALYPNAKLSEQRWLVRAWQCARIIADNRYWPDMCSARGGRIPYCPARGAYRVVIAELKCCGPDRAEDHPGHLVCEQHLEQLMAGAYVGRDGKTFSAVDFTTLPEPTVAAF